MGKDTHLVNIYLKIHNKRTLTMDDLRYLAQYSPECFEKTCQNVIYNRPETKPIMAPSAPAPNLPAAASAAKPDTPAVSERQSIEMVLQNLTLLEANQFPVTKVNPTEVKDLLGNLYMEMLFPHNDQDSFFNAPVEATPTFDMKA